MKKPVNRWIKSLACTAAVLLALECVCRICGRPRGDFEPVFPDCRDLYPRNQAINMTWGLIPYVVETNNRGFRGDDIAEGDSPAIFRILTVGDSITDGFFVDNPATWQAVLQAELRKRLGMPVEVINGARGGGSLRKELHLLRQFAPDLKPDLVILTFVSNDIYDIFKVPREDLLWQSSLVMEMTPRQWFSRLLTVHTGLGEVLFSAYISFVSPEFRERMKPQEVSYDDRRYAIPGGANFEENVARFRKRFATRDGLVLGDSFTPRTENVFSNYCMLLNIFAEQCETNNAAFLFMYFPAYSQVYDTNSPRYVNERLRSVCGEHGIEFFDMTDGFITAGTNRVMHLAPADFHLNPEGHRVFAGLVADYLVPRLPPGRTPAKSFWRAWLDRDTRKREASGAPAR